MNPELLRNLWLQFSPERIIAAPLILGAAFALAAFATDGSWEVVARAASWGYVVIAYLWGTRRAVNVLADEIAAGTWDGQRMSSIGPWTMAWGKLLGGTAYVWYCALLCLAVYTVGKVETGRQHELLIGLPLKITGALLAQTVALVLALMLVGKGRRLSRRSLAFAQGGALLIGLFGVSSVLLPSLTESFGFGAAQAVTWFGIEFSADEFTLLTQVLFLGWAVVAAYRLMAGELQLRQRPWVWLSFSLFLIAYYQGFLLLGPDAGLSLRFFSALLVAVPLYYLAMFAQTNDVIRYRWLFHHVRGGTWRNALSLLPLWMPSLALAAGLAVVVAVLTRDEVRTLTADEAVPRMLIGETWSGGIATAIALILFMLRDLGIVLLLNFGKRPKAPDLAALLYLIVLYGVCGGLVAAAGAGSLLPLFLPGAGNNAVVVVLAPLVQVILVAVLLQRRWQAQTRALQPQPAG
jgi:hypothetical protein